MLSRLLFLSMVALALAGLTACDSSDYRRSGGQWSHGDARFTPEHAASFKPLDRRFARDSVRGYCRGVVIDDSDGPSFVVVSDTEARDRASVYVCDTHRDAREYWSVRHLRIVRIEGADAATYASIGKGYSRDAHRVYFGGRPFDVRDPATFEPLDGDFARDAQRGYSARVEIPGSHGPTFRTIDERDTAYARDRANGYYAYRDREQSGAAGEPHRGVRTLPGADAAALRVLGRDYATDGQHVWHEGRTVVGADPATFTVDATHQAEADAKDRSGPWNAGARVVVPQ